MKKIFLVTSLITFIVFAGSVLAQSSSSGGGLIQLPNPLGVDKLEYLIMNIISGLAGLIGILAVIMFIWAGILFLTSAGNEAQIGKAKKAVLYAVIGLAIALAGQALVEFVEFLISGTGSSS